METFTLDEFTTGAWGDREEYESNDIGFEHVQSLHVDDEKMQMDGRFPPFVAFLNTDGLIFHYYTYAVSSWSNALTPRHVEPFMWIYGAFADGVRECSGGQNFTGDLQAMAAALNWIHADIESRRRDFWAQCRPTQESK